MNNVETEKNSYDMIIGMRLPVFICLIFISIFGVFITTNAQGFGVDEGNLIIEFIPEIPKENEIVYVYVKSYSLNVDSAKFTWKINGKTIKSGYGEKVFNFTMGEIGQKINLDMIVDTLESGLMQKNYSFVPVSIDLIWQSNGYVPPFYKGKSLFGHQNNISVIAVPHIPGPNGVDMNPKNMIYKWKKNGSVMENASGFGRNVLNFEGSLISRDINITVEVTSSDEKGFAYGNTKIKPINPSILVYKKDLIYGIEFQKAIIGDYKINNLNEISLFAAPFFFEDLDYDNDLAYKWSINGIPIRDIPGSGTQVFRKKEGAIGTSNISVSIENTERILQFAESKLNLTFDKK